VRLGINGKKELLKKGQVILETVLALSMLILFLLGAMAILKEANNLGA
jgi:uncharacterized protein (UPF0333 family)